MAKITSAVFQVPISLLKAVFICVLKLYLFVAGSQEVVLS